jgi:hypothetical protein
VFLAHHQTPHVGQDNFFGLGLFDGCGVQFSRHNAVRNANAEEKNADVDHDEEPRRKGNQAHDGVSKDVHQALGEVQVRVQKMGGE